MAGVVRSGTDESVEPPLDPELERQIDEDLAEMERQGLVPQLEPNYTNFYYDYRTKFLVV